MNEPRVFGLDQLAKRWNVSRKTIERGVASKNIAAFKVGRQWRVKLAEVMRIEDDTKVQVLTD